VLRFDHGEPDPAGGQHHAELAPCEKSATLPSSAQAVDQPICAAAPL
jgi:hypothetical protein